MKIKKLLYTILGVQLLSIIGGIYYVAYNEKNRENINKYLISHPESISNLIDMNPELFTNSIKNAQLAGKPLLSQDQKLQLGKIKATNFEARLYESDIILYPKNKEQVIVYTDFECPYCRGQFKVFQEFNNLSLIIRPVSLANHKKGQFLSLIFLYISYYHKDKVESFYKTFFEHQDKFLATSQDEILKNINQMLGTKITLDQMIKDKKISLHLSFIKAEAKAINLDSVPSLHIRNHVSSGLTGKEVIDSLLLD